MNNNEEYNKLARNTPREARSPFSIQQVNKEMYPLALEIATLAHKGQTRNGNGEPYIEHPKRVAAKFKSDIFKTVAILHDVIEDHPEFEPLIKKLFPEEAVIALKLVTRNKDQNYFEFIMKIKNSKNQVAIGVKIGDIEDNSQGREEGSKTDKYRFAFYILNN